LKGGGEGIVGGIMIGLVRLLSGRFVLESGLGLR
jgi:hypothetical protein